MFTKFNLVRLSFRDSPLYIGVAREVSLQSDLEEPKSGILNCPHDNNLYLLLATKATQEYKASQFLKNTFVCHPSRTMKEKFVVPL